MKLSELRIGNWITDLDALENRHEIQVEHLDPDAEHTAEPIQLTEEWLVRFGFKLIHEANKHYAIQNPNGYKDLHKIHFFPTINEQWHLAFSDSTSGRDETYIPASHIKYVHELQNLYYALTKEELVLVVSPKEKTK